MSFFEPETIVYGLDEIAEVLGVSPRTVKRMIASGELSFLEWRTHNDAGWGRHLHASVVQSLWPVSSAHAAGTRTAHVNALGERAVMGLMRINSGQITGPS